MASATLSSNRLTTAKPSAESGRERPRSRVVRYLVQRIESGDLGAGEVLPSAQELSQLLEVNWRTADRALQMLDEQGITRSNGGRLRTVAPCAAPKAGALANTVAMLTWHEEFPLPNHRREGWGEFVDVGVMRAVGAAGRHVLSINPGCIDAAQIRQLLAGRPYGLIASNVSYAAGEFGALTRAFEKQGVPVVFYGDAESIADCDRVTSDHEAGSYALTRHLIERGRTRILMVWPRSSHGYWFQWKRAGYERAMREAGLQPLEPLHLPIDGDTNPADAAEFESLVRLNSGYFVEHLSGAMPVDALMAHTDSVVPLCGAICQLFGRAPNRDVDLVGYDNYWQEMPIRRFDRTVPLASVDKHNLHIGHQLMRLLTERVGGSLPAQPQRLVVAPTLAVTDAQLLV